MIGTEIAPFPILHVLYVIIKAVGGVLSATHKYQNGTTNVEQSVYGKNKPEAKTAMPEVRCTQG